MLQPVPWQLGQPIISGGTFHSYVCFMTLVPAQGEKEILSLGPPSLRGPGALCTVYAKDRPMGLDVMV